MNNITVSYADASRLNEIIFDNYIANLVDVTKTATLISQFNSVINLNNIVITIDQQQWLDNISFSDNWVNTLAQSMIYTYQLRDTIGQPLIFGVQTPAQLNIIRYLPGDNNNPGWSDGTYSYFNLFYADPLQTQTLPVTDLVIYAKTDPNIPLSDRKFIQGLIG